MNLWDEAKSIPISRSMVWAAYLKVRSNKGSAGIDEVSMEEFDANRRKHLYKLWNRMASGSYFPPPVKEVEIPKKDGKVRKLGVPTISDRVGQMVVKMFIEPRLEEIFSSNSYGYRPGKNAHQALASVRANCWKQDWVIDLDIKGFFDNIDHNKLMLAVEKHAPENWVKLYIKRWLEAPVVTQSGELIQKQGKGTPQGGVISPRTHPQTLSLSNAFQLKEEDFKFDNFIKGNIFVKYEKITELGIGKTYQSCLCFTEERNTAFSNNYLFDGEVWRFQNTGIPVCSAGQRNRREISDSGKYCGVYSETSPQFDQKSKIVCEFQRNVYQQSGQDIAGSVFSKEKLWRQNRGKLKYHSLMTVCGRKSALRFTICLSQRIIPVSLLQMHSMN